MISGPVRLALAATDVIVVFLLLVGIAVAARAERSEPGVAVRRRYWLAALGLVAWDVAIVLLARDGAFASKPSTLLPAIAPAIAIPIVIGVRTARRADFRARLERIPLEWIVGVQLYRIAGVLFLIAYFENAIPGAFAIPAGVGDVLVGLAAPAVAHRLRDTSAARGRALARAWCAAGIGDLTVAVTCGFLTAPSAFQLIAPGTPNDAITRYPFVLIPAFLVPVSVVLHLFALARAGRRSQTETLLAA